MVQQNFNNSIFRLLCDTVAKKRGSRYPTNVQNTFSFFPLHITITHPLLFCTLITYIHLYYYFLLFSSFQFVYTMTIAKD